jgi:hypothetical protein
VLVLTINWKSFFLTSKSVRTIMRPVAGEDLGNGEQGHRKLATSPGSLMTRCFTECIEHNLTPEECVAYIEGELAGAGGHAVGDVVIKVQTPRNAEVLAATYWMVEVPANIDGQMTCDRNMGQTYYPFMWSTPSGDVPVENIACRGLSAGECCLAVRSYGQTTLGGQDTNGYCLACFAHQEVLIPVCNDALGTTEYQDYIYNDPDCVKVELTVAEVASADAVTQTKVDSAITSLVAFAGAPTCSGFDSMLEKLYDAAVVIKPLSVVIGDLACSYCYGPNDLDITGVGPSDTFILKILALLQDSFSPSIENCIIIYTDDDGKIVDIPKLGGSRADDPYDDDCEDVPFGNNCAAGFFAGPAGECLPCPAGTQEEGGVCLPCEAGTFSGEGAHMCTPCADRTIAPAPGGVAVCTPCEEGYIEVGNTKCEICPAGTCQLLNECEPCFAGLFQANPGQTFCLPCPRGSVQPLEGQPVCIQCPVNFVQPTRGQTECVACPAGTLEGIRDICVPF